VDHHDLNDGFSGLWPQYILLGALSVAIAPAQRAFDDPPFGTHGNPLGHGRSLDDAQPYGPIRPPGPDAADQLAGLGLVGPDLLEARKRVPEDLQQRLGVIAILDVGRRDHHGED
jgi:hypothetical protein